VCSGQLQALGVVERGGVGGLVEGLGQGVGTLRKSLSEMGARQRTRRCPVKKGERGGVQSFQKERGVRL